ncbi:triple gene block 2-like protein [Ribes americanum virus A]|uniref:Triple gene block 2-like protein n=1 Tax=Ribes americanum virus A TaxID=1569057 RepID=A0A345F6V2_9VIRU|nr:triple gene block 2-like protein [Ribes americanum virus A]AXG24093.1 triple gene block 2-like protein [Ribes americanum virus A]
MCYIDVAFDLVCLFICVLILVALLKLTYCNSSAFCVALALTIYSLFLNFNLLVLLYDLSR